jgi:ABC-type transport system involved in Fe-S cluster assembly fused permease/ATPase subunit
MVSKVKYYSCKIYGTKYLERSFSFRFYDPESGSIKLGGKDIREVNLRWMRERYL